MPLPKDGVLRESELEISVIIPLLNAKHELPDLLEALRKQSLPAGSFEVILIDNGSVDGSVAWLADHGSPGIRVLCCHHRRGSYAARNMGLEAARADNIAFTDADGRPEAGWLEAGLKALRQSPRVAGRIDLVCSDRRSVAELVDAGRFLRQRRFVREGFGATANLFVRREVFDRVGFFDDLLISGGDHEFGQRANAQGFPIIYDNDSAVRHPCRKTFRGIFKKAFRVGFGFGQSLGLRDRITIRSVLSRAVDRMKLSTGRGLKDRREIDLGPSHMLRVSFLIMILNLVTLAAVPFGFLSTSRNAVKIRRLTPKSLRPQEKVVAP